MALSDLIRRAEELVLDRIIGPVETWAKGEVKAEAEKELAPALATQVETVVDKAITTDVATPSALFPRPLEPSGA